MYNTTLDSCIETTIQQTQKAKNYLWRHDRKFGNIFGEQVHNIKVKVRLFGEASVTTKGNLLPLGTIGHTRSVEGKLKCKGKGKGKGTGKG